MSPADQSMLIKVICCLTGFSDERLRVTASAPWHSSTFSGVRLCLAFDNWRLRTNDNVQSIQKRLKVATFDLKDHFVADITADEADTDLLINAICIESN